MHTTGVMLSYGCTSAANRFGAAIRQVAVDEHEYERYRNKPR